MTKKEQLEKQMLEVLTQIEIAAGNAKTAIDSNSKGETILLTAEVYNLGVKLYDIQSEWWRL